MAEQQYEDIMVIILILAGMLFGTLGTYFYYIDQPDSMFNRLASEKEREAASQENIINALNRELALKQTGFENCVTTREQLKNDFSNYGADLLVCKRDLTQANLNLTTIKDELASKLKVISTYEQTLYPFRNYTDYYIHIIEPNNTSVKKIAERTITERNRTTAMVNDNKYHTEGLLSPKTLWVDKVFDLYYYVKDKITTKTGGISTDIQRPSSTIAFKTGKVDEKIMLLISMIKAVEPNVQVNPIATGTDYMILGMTYEGYDPTMYTDSYLPDTGGRNWILLDPSCSDCKFGEIKGSYLSKNMSMLFVYP